MFVHSRAASPPTVIHVYVFDLCRYLGLQVGYKVAGIVLLMMLGWKVHRTQEYSLEKSPEGLL